MDPANPSSLMQLFLANVAPFLVTGLVSLTMLALKALWQKLEADKSGSKLAAATAFLAHASALAVADIEATLRPLIRGSLADGKLSPEEGAKLKAAAIAKVKSYAMDHGAEVLKGVVDILAPSFTEYVGGFIEKEVAKLPPSTPAPMAVFKGPTAAAMPVGLTPGPTGTAGTVVVTSP